MSSSADFTVWVGVSSEDVPLPHLAEDIERLFDPIYSGGEIVGYGEMCDVFDWNFGAHTYPPFVVGPEVVERVKQALADLGLSEAVKIYCSCDYS